MRRPEQASSPVSAILGIFGVDGVGRAMTAAPIIATVCIAVLFALAALSVGTLVLHTRGRRRSRMSRIALNNMTQGLCMFDSRARLVLCNAPYIEMHRLQREQLRVAMPLREMLVLRAKTGTFSGDPDQYVAACLKQAAEGRSDAERSSSMTAGSSGWRPGRWRAAAG